MASKKTGRKNVLRSADPLAPESAYFGKTLEPIARKAYNHYLELEEEDADELAYTRGKGHEVYYIYPIQYVVGSVFNSIKGIMALFAEMGTGKTLMAASAADASMRCLIIVPTGVMGTWINLLEKYGLYKGNPEDGGFIVYQAGKPNHIKYLDTVVDPKGNKQIIVVVKDSTIPKALAQMKRIGLGGNELSVIVDEAHLKKPKLIEYIQPLVGIGGEFSVTRELLMSGSNIDTREIGFDTAGRKATVGHYKIDYSVKVRISNPVPEDRWEIIMMNQSFFSDVDAWRKQIEKIISKYKRTVIASQGDQFEALNFNNTKWQEKHDRDVYINRLGVKGTIDKFNNAGKAILWINTYANEGLNISGANTMIIIHPGTITVESIIQTAGRILRPENKNKSVDIYLMCFGEQEFLKAFYAKTFSYKPWNWGHDTIVNTPLVSKSLAIIRMLGSGPNEIGRVDGCIIMGDYTSADTNAEEVVEWWRQNVKRTGEDTVLTKAMIEDLV